MDWTIMCAHLFTSRRVHSMESCVRSLFSNMSSRSILTPRQLADVLRPHIDSKKALTYGESCEFKVDVSLLTKHKQLLLSLRSAQPNLSFKKTSMTEALDVLGQESEQWKLDDEKYLEWKRVSERRIHMMCRHVSQAFLRKPQPRWLEMLLDPTAIHDQGTTTAGDDEDDDIPMAQSDNKDEDEVPPADIDAKNMDMYDFGYDPEHAVAWRIEKGVKRKCKEWSVPPLIEPSGLLDPMMARFDDGMQWPIESLLLEDHLKSKASGGKTANKLCFMKHHSKTKHKVEVKIRADRKLLISMKEQGRPRDS